ncbi:hypothetical protein ANO14919_079360 [Xylariales sp. No.14919]|nr:hypothetical protein ANO14919_079360 [Xylariales sp. No.14919]
MGHHRISYPFTTALASLKTYYRIALNALEERGIQRTPCAQSCDIAGQDVVGHRLLIAEEMEAAGVIRNLLHAICQEISDHRISYPLTMAPAELNRPRTVPFISRPSSPRTGARIVLDLRHAFAFSMASPDAWVFHFGLIIDVSKDSAP